MDKECGNWPNFRDTMAWWETYDVACAERDAGHYQQLAGSEDEAKRESYQKRSRRKVRIRRDDEYDQNRNKSRSRSREYGQAKGDRYSRDRDMDISDKENVKCQDGYMFLFKFTN